MRRQITPSLVISVLALFVALGGTGYAISKLPKNSVGAKQIKKNAVTSPKVKDRTLMASDFKAGQLPAGQKGETGATGATGTTGAAGEAGSALAYAYVEDIGPQPDVVAEQSMNIDTSMVSRPSTGVYCFQLETLWPAHVAAVTTEPSSGTPSENDKYGLAQIRHNSDFQLGCPNTSDMVVVVRDQSAAAPINWFFYVTVN